MAAKPKKATAVPTGKNQGGRPELDPADRREKIVRVVTNEAEYKLLQEAAAYASQPMSIWLRSVGLERARALAAEKETARTREK